jgi:translation elongation factor EF-Tu-like GTPase
MAEKLIGKVNHWFGRIGVAGIELTDQLTVGDRIHILGHTTDFDQEVTSMQIMHQDVSAAGPGDAVGVKARFKARPGDCVYKVTE